MKTLMLHEGDKVAYQVFIEEIIGPFLAHQLPYKDDEVVDYGNNIRPGDAYFEFDADYEIRIIKKGK